MRLILLLLILAVTTQAGLLDIGKVKDFFKGGKYGEKIKNATLLKFKKLFEKTGILSLGSKLSEMRSKLMKKLELSKLKKVEVDRKIKEILAKRDDTVEKAINTIFDISAGSNVGQLLYQSDILLTKKQAEEVIEGIEGKNGQMKRQAFKDDFFPDNNWVDGVFYRFDESIEPHFILVLKSEGCFSEVGRVGFDQWLSLGQGCDQVQSDMRDDYQFCNYWIEATEGKRIEVKINAISHGYDHEGCVLGGVEIKSSEDQTRTGYRFCSTKDKDTVLVSARNRMPVIMFNRSGEQQIILEYKIV
ncbi:astacin [Ostertagia ostertagi]